MRLRDSVELFELGGIPMAGNTDTGGIIGLTPQGERLCRAMAEGDVDRGEVPEDCEELLAALGRGGYLDADGPRARRSPASAYLHVTQRCNLSCRFCYSEDAGRNALPDPSLDDLLASVDLLAALGVRRLVVSGGEPFLRDDLEDVARHAAGAGIAQVVVLTNGLLVTEERLRPLAGLVSCVAVAFDGTSDAAVAHLRGRQSFSRLVRAVEVVRAAGIETRILPTLHGRNLGDIEGYRRLADELGATLSFSLLCAPADDLGDYALGEGQMRELARRALEGVTISNDDVASGPVGAALCARRSCGAGVTTLSVAADGTVYPCHMLHDPRLAMGSAWTASPEDIASSPVAQSFLELDAADFERCGDCGSRVACGGGCRARALWSSGDLRGCDPYCELSRSYYDLVGARLARRFGREG